MIGQSSTVGVQDCCHTDFRPQVLGIAAKLLEGLAGGLKQGSIDLALMFPGQGAQLRR